MAYLRISKTSEGHSLYDYFVEADKRSLPGHQADSFYGLRRNVRRADGWVECSPVDLYWSQISDTPDLYIVSDSADDNNGLPDATRPGAGRVRINTIVTDRATAASLNGNLAGTTPSNVSEDGDIWRVNAGTVRAGATTQNIAGSNVGNITLYDNNDPTRIYAYMPAGYGVFTNGRYTVWPNTRWIFTKIVLSTSQRSNFDLQVQVKSNSESGSSGGLTAWRSIYFQTGIEGARQFDMRGFLFRGFEDTDFRILVRNRTPVPGDINVIITGMIIDQRCLTPEITGSGVSFV